MESYKVGCFPIRVLVEIDYFHNRYLPKWNFILIPWLGWWSSGQRACPLLRRFEFAKCRFQRTKIDRGWPFKKPLGLNTEITAKCSSHLNLLRAYQMINCHRFCNPLFKIKSDDWMSNWNVIRNWFFCLFKSGSPGFGRSLCRQKHLNLNVNGNLIISVR